MGRDFQRVLRFGGQQDQVKLVSLSVGLNFGNVDSVCPTSPPMPDTRRPDLRNASAESVLRAASRTGSPVRMARAAIVPPNAPMPSISICILKPPRWPSCPVFDRMTIESRLCADLSLADDHRLAADLNLFENSSTARERNVNTTWAAHADALEAHEPRLSLGRYSVVLEQICAQRSTRAAGGRILRDA